jgi:hypothetical protein
MSAAAPPPVSAPPPKTTPAAPAAPSPRPRPRVRELHDSGTIRKESVDADRWVATGLIKVTGDANLGEGKLDGTVSLGGRLSATRVQYRGVFDVDAAVEASESLSGVGSLRVGSTVHTATADLKGTVRVSGALTVDRALTVHGSLVAPSATVGELSLEGDARIPGDLVALRVDAYLKENSSFARVRARSVTLRAKPPNLVEKVFFRRVSVSVARIEADEVELEAVEAKFVRAPKITLGREAHVTEYEGTIVKRHPSSRVGFESKSPPPYGLRR